MAKAEFKPLVVLPWLGGDGDDASHDERAADPLHRQLLEGADPEALINDKARSTRLRAQWSIGRAQPGMRSSPPMSQLKLVMQQGRRKLLDGSNCARYAHQAPDRRRVALFLGDLNSRCDDFVGFRSMFTD
jgi:hypothetical protein